MLEYKIAFDRPWIFAILVVAAFLLFFPYFRTPRNKRRSFGRIASLVVRSVAVVVATFLLSGISVTEEVPKPTEEAMVIVVDYSDSISEISDKIESYIGTLLTEKTPTTQVRLVKFSGNAIEATKEFTTDGTAAYEEFVTTKITGVEPMDSTNINAALRKAASLFPSDMRAYKRVVLISDGRETTGSAWEAAAELDAQSIRLDTISFDVTDEEGFAEVSMLSLGVLPDHVVSAGTIVRMQVKIYSSVDTDGVLHFYDGEEEVERYPVPISVGDNIFSKSYKTSADATGLHNLRVSFEPKGKRDAISENNELGTWIKVTGTPRILLVGDEAQTEKLYTQVKDIYNTDCCTAADFPRTMEEILPYDEIVLMDVSADDLHDEADDMLNRFVYYIGRGLLTTCGMTEDTYMSYTENESLLADMLPVQMTFDETDFNVAIVLVIDDSGSMISGGVDKFQAAIEGAQRVVEALGENDYLGIVTFHGEATAQMELTKPENPEELIELIRDLECRPDNSGTDFAKGLTTAFDMIDGFKGARSKHVVLLTDGEPYGNAYGEIPGAMKRKGITLSTISILTGTNGQNLLAEMANNGGGKPYNITSKEDLDSISTILEDLTVQAKVPQFVNTDPFNPIPGDDTGVLNQVQADEMTIGGYIGSTLKSGADMPLQSLDFRPLIAEWDWGQGHVITLMMDMTSSWCADFFKEENNGFGLIRNLTSQPLNDEVMVSGITLTGKQNDRVTHLTVNTSYLEKGQVVKVAVNDKQAVFSPDAEGYIGEIVLSTAGGTRYTGIFDPDAMTGVTTPSDTNRIYYFRVTQYRAHEETVIEDGVEVKTTVLDDVLDETYVAYNGGILAEYDIYNIDGNAVMEGIAKTGGGSLMTSTNELFNILKEGSEEFSINLQLPCSILLAALLMFDILVRNVRFKHKKKKS